MNVNDISDKLSQINIEDFIWLIYLGIIILSYISNHFERDYYLNNNLRSKYNYQKLLTIIFSILIVVYLYFLKDSVTSLMRLKQTDSPKKKKLVYLSFIGSLLIAISGFIFLYISYVDDNLDVELAFN